MAFMSFLGRLLFVSVFVLSAYQEITRHMLSQHSRSQAPVKEEGCDRFGEPTFNEFGADGGPAAKHLRPKFSVFAKHVTAQTGLQVPHVDMKNLILGAIAVKALGSLLFVFGSSLGASILLLHQAISAPILYDFYNYDADKKEFAQLFVKFTQNLALLGGLLFFIGMKNSMPRRSPKKKSAKAKTH